MNPELIMKSIELGGFIPAQAFSQDKPTHPGPIDFENKKISLVPARQANHMNNDQTETDLDPKIWPKTEPELEGIQRHGIDYLAWYTPFHNNWSNWGIFVRARGIEILAGDLVRNGIAPSAAFNLAYSALLEHEFRHMEIEFLCSQFELIEDRHLYLPGYSVQVSKGSWFRNAEAFCNCAAISDAARSDRTPLGRTFDSYGLPGYSDWRIYENMTESEALGEIIGLIIRNRATLWILSPSSKLKNYMLKYRPAKIIWDGCGLNGSVSGLFKLNYLCRK